MKFTSYGSIENGTLKLDHPKYFRFQLERMKGKVAITIEKVKYKRSMKQNSYYWGGILPCIAESLGYNTEELHEIFKRMFLPKRIVKWRGRELTLLGSTTQLSKGEFVEYIMKISAEVATMGIRLPEPEEYFKR